MDFEGLRGAAQAQGIELSGGQLRRFNAYAEILLRENEKYNLTAITSPEEVARKHFLDSLLLLRWQPPEEGAMLLDVGSGAGFPGMVLAIAREDLRVTLLESSRKKADFLTALARALELELRVQVLCARAEEAAKQPLWRERFDFVTARAVAALPALCEYCLPFVRIGGCFAALKGSAGEQEAVLAGNAVALLGGAPCALMREDIPGLGRRSCVVIRKISQTPAKYPRKQGMIHKRSL
ncbi:MAG: 16S rRNA (guanine(527)-N(7))-methyltransferase RsmG [Oscillospiraceae bacterium]|jgi:16S rRNA (guanine(527)-N(7))-methyltransferase RsmG|nr:16S rRNA (guanine(527)-N(7))-methyltransferase RsmG [Oscillospiraceae bacterium]